MALPPALSALAIRFFWYVTRLGHLRFQKRARVAVVLVLHDNDLRVRRGPGDAVAAALVWLGHNHRHVFSLRILIVLNRLKESLMYWADREAVQSLLARI